MCPIGLASIPNQHMPSQHIGGVRGDIEKKRGGMEEGEENITEELSMPTHYPAADTEFKVLVEVKAENL